LDVSNNLKLTQLQCNNNHLSVLDVSNNLELTQLDCHSNNLSVLDVSNNLKLTQLDCSRNPSDPGCNPMATLWLKTGQEIADLNKPDETVIQYK
jgi:Leucine-rich repeat (LRR) protein